MVQNIIKILLLVIIIVLAYLVVESVMGPVRFNKSVTERSDAVIQNLKDIRSAQLTYKTIHGHYMADFDTLINFLKYDSIPVVKMIPDPKDTTFSKTIRDTIGSIAVLDSLFSGRLGFIADNLKFVPFTENEKFTMDAGIIEKGGVEVNVFEASVHYNIILSGLDEQMVVNLIASKEQINRYPGLKVGSMFEASTDGNWE
jgi:type II secretory pathway pseudopilin PulG